MSKLPIIRPQTIRQPHSAAILLILTMLDTTWRAFVPTIGGTLLGVLLDNTFKTAPVITFVMIILGFAISGVLIVLQLRSVRKK